MQYKYRIIVCIIDTMSQQLDLDVNNYTHAEIFALFSLDPNGCTMAEAESKAADALQQVLADVPAASTRSPISRRARADAAGRACSISRRE